MVRPLTCIESRFRRLNNLKILLLSAYTAASHQYWVDGLQQNLADIEWTVLVLPPRHFSWRIRGNSLTWAFSERELLTRHYDVLLATSMVDLAALRGMVPELCSIPTVVYFHENQFVYPQSEIILANNRANVEPQLVNLYSALCADQLVFNSQYNRDSFLDGVGALLRKLPDGVPSGLVDRLQARAQTLPVPLANDLFSIKNSVKTTTREQHFQLVWNHRWEYDKGPERLLTCLQALPEKTTITIHVLGQNFRQKPGVFTDIKALLNQNQWLGEWGFVDDRQRYLNLLANADGVLSTALHDFQGLAILEAYVLGCVPIVPDRLAYREFIPDRYRYRSELSDPVLEAMSASEKILQAIVLRQTEAELDSSANCLSWNSLGSRYRSLLIQPCT